MEIIKGQQVILRPATPYDRQQIYQWLTQSDLTAQMLGPPLFPDAAIPTWEYFVADYNPEFFNDHNPYTGRSFIIEINGEPIGQINYNEIDRATHTVELDIWLRSSAYCNQGYGTDAINILCSYLASHLNCQTFILAPSARNQVAIRAYTKCGFKPTNAPPANFIPDYNDTVVMVKNIIPTRKP